MAQNGFYSKLSKHSKSITNAVLKALAACLRIPPCRAWLIASFETCPKWVPGMDKRWRSPRISLKALLVDRFVQRASRPAKVRKVSDPGRRENPGHRTLTDQETPGTGESDDRHYSRRDPMETRALRGNPPAISARLNECGPERKFNQLDSYVWSRLARWMVRRGGNWPGSILGTGRCISVPR